jgi:hypothetical protein
MASSWLKGGYGDQKQKPPGLPAVLEEIRFVCVAYVYFSLPPAALENQK